MACQPKNAKAILKPDSPPQATATTDKVNDLYRQIEEEDNVVLENLVYYLDYPLIIRQKDGFTLDGNGCTFIMRNKSENVVQVEGSVSVVLKNFKATHLEPDGPIGCTGSVVQVANSETVMIADCELNGSGIIGVVAYNAEVLSIVDNYIYNNSQYGILYDRNSSLTIVRNRFEANGTDGNAHIGQAMNDFLTEVNLIVGEQNKSGLQMSNNTFD